MARMNSPFETRRHATQPHTHKSQQEARERRESSKKTHMGFIQFEKYPISPAKKKPDLL
jgi:hypothetical protein